MRVLSDARDDTIGTVPSVSFSQKQKTGQLMLPGLLFKNDTEGTVPIVSFEVTYGVVNLLALILAVEQQGEVVGTEP